MSQYALGTVNVTHGSPVVTGVGTAWAANVQAGGLFTVRKTGVVFTISSVDSDTQITLTAPYGGSTQSGLTYAISLSFTPNYRLPYPEPGDVEAVSILKEQVVNLEELLKNALSPEVVNLSANTTLDGDTYRGRIVLCTSGVTALVLPNIATVETGWRFMLNTSTNVTISGDATVDGASSGIVNGSRWVAKDDTGHWVTYSGNAQGVVRQGFCLSVMGTFLAAEEIAMFKASDPMTYSATACTAICKTAPTSSAAFTIKKNGTLWCTITFASGATTATFSFVNTSQAAGDVLEFYAPSSVDPTLVGVSINLAGS